MFEWLLLVTLLAWGITGLVLRFAPSLGLIHAPNIRSAHSQRLPHGGGIAIVLAATGGGLLLGEGSIISVLGLALILAIISLVDDIKHLSVMVRLGTQFFVVFGFITLLASPNDSLLNGTLWFGLLLFAGLWWINLFNFMDGIDGIAGMQTLFMLLVAAALSAWVTAGAIANPIWLFMLIVPSATLGFLCYNWPPARIFMGDVGSIWLAFMIFSLAILSIQADWLNYSTWLLLGAVFITDATLTLINRILRGERWHEAHCDHAYQHLSQQWAAVRPRTNVHQKITLGILCINLLWLSPLAAATLFWPQYAWGWVILGYAPLIAVAFALSAGKNTAKSVNDSTS